MSKRAQIILGGAILAFGLVALLATVFEVDVWALCWGIGLILLGMLILLRPRLTAPGSKAKLRFVADINRSGDWTVSNEEIWTFVADAKYDLTSADLPPGETTIRFVGFVSDIVLILPKDVGISVSLTSFYNQLRFLGTRDEAFVSPIEQSSDGYDLAERKIKLETVCFVSDIKVRSEPA